MTATLCQHGNTPKNCGKCAKAASKARAKADEAAAKAAAKRRRKSAKYQAKSAGKKVNQVKDAAKDMKTPWYSDGTSRSGMRDAQGRSRAGIRYDSRGKRIWNDD